MLELDAHMKRVFWAETSVVVDYLPFKGNRIPRKDFRHETVNKLVLFVDVRVAFHEHSGDHDGPKKVDASGITSRRRLIQTHAYGHSRARGIWSARLMRAGRGFTRGSHSDSRAHPQPCMH